MQYPIPGPRSVRRLSAAALLLLAACGGDAVEERAKDTSAADVKEVDQKSSPTATDRELASFKEPADSVLTPEQVNAFLRTSLLQFDLIQQESGKYREQAARMAQRAEQNKGAVSGFRNGMDAMQWLAGFGDLVGGSYTRAARSQGYNPAEMDWVRARMMEVSGHLMMRPMLEMGVQSAQAMRQQAEQMRGTPGFDEAAIQEMLKNADDAEKQAREQMNASGAVVRNIEVLRRARPNVTDHMWMTVSMASTGLMGLTGLADPNDTTAARTFAEFRQVYTDALANKVTPGMEADKAQGEAKPQVSTPAPGQGN